MLEEKSALAEQVLYNGSQCDQPSRNHEFLMQATNRFAFKEWAVICAALAAGRQSLILRKGGIHEGRAGFRVEHPEFWLFPTNFHQSMDDLAPGYQELWETVGRQPPEIGHVSLRYYAVVDEVLEIGDEGLLARLEGLHGWSNRVVTERFRYKHDGLFGLLVRVFELPQPFDLPESPHFAGCRSWVDLPEELPTAGLRPVLTDAEHERRWARIRNALV